MLNNNFKKKMTAINTIFVGSVAAMVLIASQAVAAQDGHLKVTSKVQKMVVVNKDGATSYKFLPATKVLPGETVQYNTIFENVSNKAADNINIVNPIPENLVYLPNSATGKNTNVVFSVDGGRNYGKAGTLRIKKADGKVYLAKPSDYTHIQWQYLGNLAPKTKQAVQFRARLL